MRRTRQTLQAKCRVRLAQAPVMQTNFRFCSFLLYIWLSTYSGGDNKLSTFIDPWGINPAIVILGGFFLFFCTLNEQNYLSILLFCSFHPSTLRSPRCSLYSPLNQTRWTWKSVPSRWYSLVHIVGVLRSEVWSFDFLDFSFVGNDIGFLNTVY